MNMRTGEIRPTGEMRTIERKSIELNSEEFKVIQAQIANLTQQLSLAQTVSVKEKNRSDELANLASRLQADFDNHRKRTQEAAKKMREDGRVEVVEKVIPIADTLRQASLMVKDEKVAEGLKMVLKQFMSTLETMGVTEIQSLGQPFDPNIHNAIMDVKVKDPKDVNIIVEVLTKGYRMGDKVIRYSDVKVGR